MAVPVVGLVLVGVPLALGGALAMSVPIATTIALLAVAITGIEWRELRGDRLLIAAAILMSVAAIQLVPLPPWLLATIDRNSADISSAALAPFLVGRDSTWRALHLDPGNGYSFLQYLVGLTAMYLVCTRLTVRGHRDNILGLIAGSTLWVAVLAIAHRGWDLEKLYGLYSPSQGIPPILAPLLNTNHLAAFTGAGAIIWTGRAVASKQAPARVANALAAMVCGAVCILARSRGGAAAALGGLVLFGFCHRFQAGTHGRRRARRRTFTTAGVIAAVIASGLYAGWEALSRKYEIGDYTKLGMIRAVFSTLREHPVFGAGVGGVHAAVSTTGVLPGNYTVEWAECLPVDLAVGIGPVAAVSVLVVVGLWLRRVRPPIRSAETPVIAVFAALVSLAAHDIVDFSLWLGANGYLAAAFAGVLSGQALLAEQPRDAEVTRGGARRWFLAAAAVSLAVGWITAQTPLFNDRDRVQAALTGGALSESQLRRIIARHPADPYIALVAANLAMQHHDPRALRFVNQALILAPAWSEPHVILAYLFGGTGHRSQALVEIGYAAGLEIRTHAALARLFVSLQPTADEVQRVPPQGPMGLHFLRAITDVPMEQRLAIEVDAELLRRAPDDEGALRDTLLRAHASHDVARERDVLEHLARSHPELPIGHLGLAELELQAGNSAAAEERARRGMSVTNNPRAFLPFLAQLQMRRRDTAGMRATMNRLLEMVGADVEQRIQVLAQLGALEVSLGNDIAALAAYERADAMAFPEHPYLRNIVSLAHNLNDLARLRGACNTLRDVGDLPADLHAACAVADRPPAPM